MFGKKQEQPQQSQLVYMDVPQMGQPYYDDLPPAYADIQPDSNFLLKTLDTKDLLQEIEMRLKGYYLDPNAKTWKKKTEAIMDERGIDLVVWHIIMPHFNQHMVLSYLDQKDINRFMIEIRVALSDWIIANYKSYKLSIDKFNILINEIDHPIYAFLMRTRQGKEYYRIKGGYDFSEKSIPYMPGKEEKKLFK